MAVRNFILFAAIVFLAISSTASEDIFSIIKIPQGCEGAGFCPYEPEGYKQLEEEINSLLPEYLKQSYMNRQGLEKPKPPTISPKSDWHNCPYEIITEAYLYNPGDNKSNTDIIVQTNELRQEIEMVRCARQHIPTSNEECFKDLNLNSVGLKSTCETTYSYRPLYFYDPIKKQVLPKKYPVPVCCSCKIVNTFETYKELKALK